MKVECVYSDKLIPPVTMIIKGDFITGFSVSAFFYLSGTDIMICEFLCPLLSPESLADFPMTL